MLEIPGEEAPTDPGLQARQRKEAEERVARAARSRRNRVLGALGAVALTALVGVGVWQYKAQQAVLVYDTEDYYATPLSELQSAPVPPTADPDAGANAHVPTKVPSSRPVATNGAGATLGGGTEQPTGMKSGGGSGSLDAVLQPTVTPTADRGAGGLGGVDISVNRLGMDRVLTDDAEIYDMVKRVITASGPQLQACYNQRLKQVDGLKGAWQVSFTVAKDGTTQSVRVKPVNASDAELEACLERSVSAWKFQKIYEEKPVSKSYRFGAGTW